MRARLTLPLLVAGVGTAGASCPEAACTDRVRVRVRVRVTLTLTLTRTLTLTLAGGRLHRSGQPVERGVEREDGAERDVLVLPLRRRLGRGCRLGRSRDLASERERGAPSKRVAAQREPAEGQASWLGLGLALGLGLG